LPEILQKITVQKQFCPMELARASVRQLTCPAHFIFVSCLSGFPLNKKASTKHPEMTSNAYTSKALQATNFTNGTYLLVLLSPTTFSPWFPCTLLTISNIKSFQIELSSLISYNEFQIYCVLYPSYKRITVYATVFWFK
jgi:hypothetical protein